MWKQAKQVRAKSQLTAKRPNAAQRYERNPPPEKRIIKPKIEKTSYNEILSYSFIITTRH
jgi:hypothetical protein